MKKLYVVMAPSQYHLYTRKQLSDEMDKIRTLGEAMGGEKADSVDIYTDPMCPSGSIYTFEDDQGKIFDKARFHLNWAFVPDSIDLFGLHMVAAFEGHYVYTGENVRVRLSEEVDGSYTCQIFDPIGINKYGQGSGPNEKEAYIAALENMELRVRLAGCELKKKLLASLDAEEEAKAEAKEESK